MLELILVRHGESVANRKGLIQGQLDTPLSERGEQQAQALAKRLANQQFTAVYSSDLSRAYQTAQLALPTQTANQTPLLREISRGVLEGKYFDDLPKEQQNWLEASHGEDWDFRIPEGESYTDLEKRAMEFWHNLPKEGKVLAFTHGGFIIATVYGLIGKPRERKFERAKTWGIRLENTSISRFVLHEGYTSITTIGDHAHLEGL